jgi:hypothetical protein
MAWRAETGMPGASCKTAVFGGRGGFDRIAFMWVVSNQTMGAQVHN